MHADAITPAETGRCPCRSLPSRSAVFPCFQEGRLPHYLFRGLLGVHSRFRPAWSLSRPRRPFYQSASAHVVTSMNRPGCYQPERQLLGGIRTHQESAPFHGALENDDDTPSPASGHCPGFSGKNPNSARPDCRLGHRHDRGMVGQDTLQGLQARDPAEAAHPESPQPKRRSRPQRRTDFSEAGSQVLTVLVQPASQGSLSFASPYTPSFALPYTPSFALPYIAAPANLISSASWSSLIAYCLKVVRSLGSYVGMCPNACLAGFQSNRNVQDFASLQSLSSA